MGKIVFCEDDPMIQKLIRAAFKTAGHQIFIASDGAEGLPNVSFGTKTKRVPKAALTALLQPTRRSA